MEAELRERLEEAYRTRRPLRVYLGVDPRTSDLHLGHMVPMRKLRQFQELGHTAIFLIGSFTSLVGDPSDKDKARQIMDLDTVMANARTYTEQAFKILDPEKTVIRYNHEWLAKLTFEDLIHIASNFTVQQFLAREHFRKRYDKGDAIFLHEFFYPLMQGYDAVALRTDVQVGGTDQIFNIVVAGRKLQEAFGQRPQVAVIVPILPGTDGVIKMSKSLGNHIPILAPPEDMYGKVMSLPDHVMITYFKLVTRYMPEQIEQIERDLREGRRHPRDVKMELAREIVSIFHGEDAAKRAEEHFVRVFQQRDLPEDMPEWEVSHPTRIVDIIAEAGLTKSKGEARRLIKQGGVQLDGQRVTDINAVFTPDGREHVLRVGRRRFLRLKGTPSGEG
ncbi:MAG: tyrosine--tRNA ligase [Chloroflexi bacterium]|nr:tyrosine--tRNA ligase [Chloroflexota bacterium]